MNGRLQWVLPLVTAGVVLIIWICLALVDTKHEALPSPFAVAIALGKESGQILPALGRDVLAMIGGFILASIFGIVTAILLVSYRGLSLALKPWFAIGRMTPLLVLTPLMIISPLPIWVSLMLITAIICYFPFVAIYTPALTTTDKVLVDLFKTYRADYRQQIMYLRFPHAFPSLIKALRRAAILAPLATLLTDFLAGSLANQPGLGRLLREYYEAGGDAEIYALCLIAAFTGVVLAGAVDAFAAWILAHWHDNDHGTH
ncbi:MAG: ABC transporter permease subunit [Verrucomicrobiota bacterium]